MQARLRNPAVIVSMARLCGEVQSNLQEAGVDFVDAGTTNIFRRTSEGQGRQIRHHVSIEDFRLLGGYQAAVRDSSSRA